MASRKVKKTGTKAKKLPPFPALHLVTAQWALCFACLYAAVAFRAINHPCRHGDRASSYRRGQRPGHLRRAGHGPARLPGPPHRRRGGSLATTVPVQAVLFDIDGTLCDSDPLHHVAFQELLLEIGYNNGVPIDDEFFIKNIAGRSDAEAAQNLFPDWELEKGLKFLEEKDAKYRSLAKERLEPVKGLGKVVQWVKDHGYKRAAVTNAPRINAELMISLLGLSDFFQAIIIGGECEQPKPAPYPYLKALKELQVSAEHTFIFEDSASGIRAGVAAGMPVVAVATRNPEKSLLEAGASLLIKDYEDPKLWAALEEIDREEAKLKKASA
ncbi:haloacid dehalogenase-like hydrolase domain-containing protein Sgpp [Panicum miliaceum]|uniref:Haloacid dehalogenase-like hydrolase domain-containing protein Sgpp n=1 Tax=Panicum miliaceum TaxID=4540 RepID=A0A3L6PEW6_PANMI|nr:haloacid dehalogenase-like hydrolase domain-containing protein Sgpp [Panicum miliaceum]